MASEQPPSAGLISRLIDYVDAPWKVAAVIALFIVGGAGYVFYTHQNEIVEHWMTPSEVTLQTDEIGGALEKLTDEAGADLVQVWSVDLSINSQRYLGARRKDGQRPVIPEPRRLPVIVTKTDVQALLGVIEGNPYCVELTDHGSPLARRLADRGMKWGCAIPIPPGPTAFVGVIYLAWVDRPEQGQEHVAVSAAREIANTLVSR